MRIAAKYSHLNGFESLQVNKPNLWGDIEKVIESTNAKKSKIKISKEKTMKGRRLYSPKDLNRDMAQIFKKCGWQKERQEKLWAAKDERILREIVFLPAEKQKEKIIEAGLEPVQTYYQTDFVKERVAVEVQFGLIGDVAYDLFVKHPALFARNVIDVGIEIVPMKEMASQMSSAVPYYESALRNVTWQRGVPAVPLILVGIAP